MQPETSDSSTSWFGWHLKKDGSELSLTIDGWTCLLYVGVQGFAEEPGFAIRLYADEALELANALRWAAQRIRAGRGD